jgi:putative nucleotidyltransferase with HDIG domain
MRSAGLHITRGRTPGRKGSTDGLVEVIRRKGGAGALTHGLVVGRVAYQVAQQLGIVDTRAQRIMLAGLLHDIGKTAIATAVLDKPTALNPSEWSQLHRHPVWGAQILGLHGFDDLAPWVAAHHERPDGKGYPYGLSGDAIPPEARIIAVADVWEAMVGQRPYRPPLSGRLAIGQMRNAAGTQLDADAVEAFLATHGARVTSVAVANPRTSLTGVHHCAGG